MLKKYLYFFALVVTTLSFHLCNEVTNPSPPGTHLDSLRFDVIETLIFADLMPMVPPDPVYGRIQIRLENTYQHYTIESLQMSHVSVISSETGGMRGEFRFTTDWSGTLAPGEIDTVLWTKIQEEYTPIDSVFSACGDSFTLNFSLVEQQQDSLHISVDDIVLGCAW